MTSAACAAVVTVSPLALHAEIILQVKSAGSSIRYSRVSSIRYSRVVAGNALGSVGMEIEGWPAVKMPSSSPTARRISGVVS